MLPRHGLQPSLHVNMNSARRSAYTESAAGEAEGKQTTLCTTIVMFGTCNSFVSNRTLSIQTYARKGSSSADKNSVGVLILGIHFSPLMSS